MNAAAAARAASRALLARLGPHGAVTVVEGGAAATFGSGLPAVRVEVRDARAWSALLRGGSNGLARSYVDGWWDVDDLTGLLQVLVRNLAGPVGRLDAIGRAVAPIRDRLTRHQQDPAQDRADIHAHYDLGNELYELMLDPTMSYSCARFTSEDQDLESAQRAKLDGLVELLQLEPGHRLVEIGTGWGGLAVHVAAATGCQVTTTTISDAQHEYARKRVAEAGLASRVTVLDADYRDLRGSYDRLVTVEMIEAVSWPEHVTFVDRCARLLRPGGRMVMQAIVIDDAAYERAKHRDDFIRTQIFPGGCLPSIGRILEVTSGAGLRLVELHDLGASYPPTLRAWWANVVEHGEQVEALDLGPGFLRLWQLYLAYCEAGFLERRISVVQVVLERD